MERNLLVHDMKNACLMVLTVKTTSNETSCSQLARKLGLLAICTLFLTLTGCGGNPEIPELGQNDTILAFGDSLTAGNGVPKANAYPAVLQELTSRKVVNSGKSGETTDEGLARLPTVLRRTKPDLIVLLEGGNDILRDYDLDRTKRNLKEMITLAEQRQIPVVLVGVPTKSLLGTTADLYTELAKEHRIPLEDKIIAKLLKNPSMKSDALHFNTAGYAALAEAINELLKASGAIR